MSGLSLGASVPNLEFVTSTVLKLLAYNAPNFTGSRDSGHAPFSKKIFMGHVGTFPGSIRAKFEVRIFNRFEDLTPQILRGHVTLATSSFTLFWHSGVGGRQVTSFELWTATIGSETTPAKWFNTPIENALCRCQFWGKLGKNRRYLYWILTPNERVLSHQVPDVCAEFHQHG